MNPLSKLYFSIEDRYYGFCDSLEKSGIKIYEFFVNPIEDRGVPSFPFFVLLLAIIIGGIAFLLTGFQLPFGNTVGVDVTVLSSGNEPVTGARVTLTLEDGKEFSEITKNGIAHFEGLPKDATAQLKILHPSGKYEKKVVLTGKKIIAMLEPLKKSFKVVVASTEGNPVPDALITFSDPDSGSLQQYSTNTLGEAEVIYSSESSVFRLRVTANGFESELKNCIPSQKECLIPLKASATHLEVKGNVAVSVKDEQGSPVDGAFVSLYNADGYSEAITGGYSDAQGTAFFQESVAVGTKIYVVVDADGFAPYRGAEKNDFQAVRGDKNTNFVISLKKKQNGILPVDYSKITIQVTDEADKPIANARVKLFLFSKPFKVIDDKSTDQGGMVEFEVSKTQNFYATAFADGFLPKTSRQLKAGESTKLALVKSVAGNNGELQVKVRNADGQLVANAEVELISEDGFNLGYPATETDSDGIALLSEVESDRQMKAHAVLGSQSGESDVFSVQAGETTSVEMVLERNFARILARAQDYSQSQQTFVTNATIAAYYKDQVIASCATPANGTYCNLSVYANVPVFLKAEASGFAVTQSEELTLSTDQELSKTILMLPSNLAKDVRVLNFSLYKMDSTGTVVLDAEHAATELERGGWYKASLVVSFPQAQKTGFYLRVGDKQIIAEEKAFIASFDKPPQDDSAEIDFGTTFNQENTCIRESQQQSGSERKWVAITYPSGKVGVKTLGAKIRIRPTAITNEKIDFHHRSFAVKNGLWARVPEDPELGTKENTQAKEYCFARTADVEYPVTQGFQKCTNKGCITLSLKSDNKTSSRFLSVEFGKQVLLEAKVKSFSPDSIENPIVRFSTTSNKLEIERQLHQPVLVDGEATVSTIANAFAPGNYMPVKAEFADDNGLIAAVDAVLEFTGTGELVLVVTPPVMEANLPPGDPDFQPIRATLTTAQGRPVQNAVLTIMETGETHPFLGFPNGGNTLVGDGRQDSGKNGVYVFKTLFPKTIGTFLVEADAGSEFAKTQSREVQAVATNFLSVEPTDVFISGTTACTSGVQLLLTKSIPVEAQVHWQVSGGSNESQCVEVLQPPQSPFTMKKGKAGKPETTRVIVRPIKNDNCNLAFNSVLQGSGSAGFAQTNFVVDCSNINPSPSPSPGVCSKNNCAACGESQCIDLQNRGNCKTVYDRNGSTSVFLRCEQKGKPGQGSADFCAAQRVDLGSLFASRLGYMSAQRIFNPSRNDRALASSATNKIVRIPFPPFFQAYGYSQFNEDDGEGCKASPGKLECTKKISPLVPSNGLAVSLKNALGVDTRIITARENPACFSVKKIESMGLAKAGNFLQSLISDTFGLPGTQYATLVIMFEPNKEGCASYSYDFETGETKIQPASGKDTFKLVMQDSRQPNVQFTITLKVEGTTSKFAFASAPEIKNSVLSSIPTRALSPVEPFVVANNLQFGNFGVGSATVPSKDAKGIALEFNKDYDLGVGNTAQNAKVKLTPVKVEDKAKLDVIGNSRAADANAEQALSSCAGKDFCFIDAPSEFESSLKAQVSEDLYKIVKNMDSVSYTQAFDYDKLMLETAMTSALQDYLTGLAAYAACKNLGQDPISELQQRCAQTRFSPQQLPSNMGDAFSSGFLAATCDSEVLNLASAAARGSVGVPGGYLNTLARRLISQYVAPGQAPVQTNQRIFRSLNSYINVPVKVAGENGGFIIYSFKPDANVGLSYGSVVPDDMMFSTQGFGGQCVFGTPPGAPGSCPMGPGGVPLECTPQGRCVPGAFYNSPFQFGGGFGSQNRYDFSGASQLYSPQQIEGDTIVELKGTYGFKLPKFTPADKSSQGNESAANGLPYLDAKILGDDGKPNLFTANKYGFDGKVGRADFLQDFDQIFEDKFELKDFLSQNVFSEAQLGGFETTFSKAVEGQGKFKEHAVTVVFKAGSDNTISIVSLAPEPSPQPSASPAASANPSPTPTAKPSASPTPSYEDFLYPSQELSSSFFAQEKVGDKVSTTPKYKIIATIKIRDFNEANGDLTNGYVKDSTNRAKSVAAVLSYLLDESAKLTCDFWGKATVGSKSITGIPDDCVVIQQGKTQAGASPSVSPKPPSKRWVVRENGDSSRKQLIKITPSGNKANLEFLSDFKTTPTSSNAMDGSKPLQWIFIHGTYQGSRTPSCSYDRTYDDTLKTEKIRYSNQPNEQPIQPLVNGGAYSFNLNTGNKYFVKAYYAYAKAAPTQRYHCFTIYEETAS